MATRLFVRSFIWLKRIPGDTRDPWGLTFSSYEVTFPQDMDWTEEGEKVEYLEVETLEDLEQEVDA